MPEPLWFQILVGRLRTNREYSDLQAVLQVWLVSVAGSVGGVQTRFVTVCRTFVFVEAAVMVRYFGLTYRKALASPGREGTPNFSISMYWVVRRT